MIVKVRLLSADRGILYSVGSKVFLLILLLSGCAMVADKPDGVNIVVTEPVPVAERAESAGFSLVGRISVQDEQQRFSGGVRWKHAAPSDEIFLLTPFGQTMIYIVQDEAGAYLTDAEQREYFASDIEVLTEDILGWRIPVSELRYWIRGAHFPETVAIKHIDSKGRTVAINQDGWNVSFVYDNSPRVSPIQRPGQMKLSFESLKIKLVVDQWNTEEPAE